MRNLTLVATLLCLVFACMTASAQPHGIEKELFESIQFVQKNVQPVSIKETKRSKSQFGRSTIPLEDTNWFKNQKRNKLTAELKKHLSFLREHGIEFFYEYFRTDFDHGVGLSLKINLRKNIRGLRLFGTLAKTDTLYEFLNDLKIHRIYVYGNTKNIIGHQKILVMTRYSGQILYQSALELKDWNYYVKGPAIRETLASFLTQEFKLAKTAARRKCNTLLAAK